MTALLTAVLLRVTSVLGASDIFLLFLLLLEYGLSIITFAFMLTPFFSKAEVYCLLGFPINLKIQLFTKEKVLTTN